MRRVVVDMQNALFADAIATALQKFDSDANCKCKLDTCTVEIRSSEHRTWWEPLASIVDDAVAAGGCVNRVEELFKQFFRGSVAQLLARASVQLVSGR